MAYAQLASVNPVYGLYSGVVGCMMVSVPAAIAGLSPENSLPAILALLISFSIARDLGLFAGGDKNNQR